MQSWGHGVSKAASDLAVDSSESDAEADQRRRHWHLLEGEVD